MCDNDHMLKEILEKRGMTQSELADRTGVRIGTINRLTRGVNRPSVATALAISKELGIPIEQLFPDLAVPGPRYNRPKTTG